MDKTASKNVAWVESPDGYLDRTPVLQFSMTNDFGAVRLLGHRRKPQ